jgi:dTDP-4-dehydrorhamnose 3,5-epimerase
MPFEFEALDIEGAFLATPRPFSDDRGFFMETYKYSDFAAVGLTEPFVQDNHSYSTRGVVRGLHFQRQPEAQGKLVRVLAGEIFDVIVDLRQDQPGFGRWLSVTLSAANRRMLYAPPWCAHGFCVLSPDAHVAYKVTREYAPRHESGIIWNDPAIGIRWPVTEALLSPKDALWPLLAEADLTAESLAARPGHA